jgi:hypothetical protein
MTSRQQPTSPLLDGIPSEVASHAIDLRSAQRLWELGESMRAKSGEQQ